MGGELADDGQETIRSFNYNAIFEFAVKAIQELNNIVKKQPEHKDAHKKTNWHIKIYIIQRLKTKSS